MTNDCNRKHGDSSFVIVWAFGFRDFLNGFELP
jgi:hypothetical protein